ncbi:zf-HC2 domain-containing protein [Streptomyces sp. BG9H]|uniref:Zf-HC2 domain-containing protein n=1 Tax=Streptomyces anatolicus TaxID=2675858 RepID=A0ABS6YR92_9ACTN|nr:zf-HC2 domain-containing protein [Streptomyces anatolicus]MBW5423953.1 zf-HC2 domain-containing protein [Streptomyces anatolicus]
MSGSRSNPAERRLTEAEQHLGDRLAALVDGELGHDARERVLAHLATCPMCKTEADAQRRLKSVFAQAAPPPPSESFLARLQGLPAGGSEPPGGPGDGEGFAPGAPRATGSAGLPRTGIFGVSTEPFVGYVPSGAHAAVLPGEGRGFRIHDVTRHDGDRSLWRGRRFAFAAAGAVSLAAIALGGVTVVTPTDPGDTRAGGAKTNSKVTPQRTQGSGVVATPDSVRRRGGGNPLSAQGQRPGALSVPVAPTEVTGPLLPGATQSRVHERVRELTAPMLAGAAALSPLIRPPHTAPARPPVLGPLRTRGADPVNTAAAPPGSGPLQGTSQVH